MRNRLAILLAALLLSTASNASADDCVKLRWKLPDGTLSMESVMQNKTDASHFRMDTSGLMDDDVAVEKAEKVFSEFSFPESASMTTVLKRTGENRIDLVTIMGAMKWANPPSEDDSLRELMDSMAGTVQLRGQIDGTGKVTSFYTPQRQKNLIAIFLQLPARCVSVGDTWSLGISLIEMDHNFIPENAVQNNTVELLAVERSGEDAIAVIQYRISEAVAGDFVHPINGKSMPTTMSMSYLGEGRFNIDEGRWEKLVGEMSLDATGVMEAKSRQVMAIRPMASND